MDTKLAEDITHLLDGSGIKINGPNPWDIKVHDNRFFTRVLTQGSLGFGESYMDGWWDCDQLDELIARIMRQNITGKLKPNVQLISSYLKNLVFNPQTKRRSRKVGKIHYDVGNDLFSRMLDKRMAYSCGYWANATSLDEAQEAKLDLICKKINLQPGQRILDIGCGWGSFAKFAAEKYGVRVVGITISKQQVKLGRKLCHGFPVEIRFQDYRDVNEQFDHIISVGMFEHVGYKNYRTFFKVAHRCLADDGLLLLHTIGTNISGVGTDPWISKYIFPNSMLPSALQIAKAHEGLMVMEDWHNFSADYDKTLMAWYRNFESSWEDIKNQYDERFHRMWRFYLLACAGVFRARKNQLWQIVFSKNGIPGGYKSIR
ncbi:MAG: cyclopropane fatty acyl phospholipid synthase [Patescibacteria group bacterium]|nr:cyclopropane fatty acyl phospholipid synthase [Patescibacteria group bacterium]